MENSEHSVILDSSKIELKVTFGNHAHLWKKGHFKVRLQSIKDKKTLLAGCIPKKCILPGFYALDYATPSSGETLILYLIGDLKR